MTGKKIRSKEEVGMSLLPLLKGVHKKSSSALHDLQFVGPLRRWSNFARAVEVTANSQTWSNRVIKCGLKSRNLDTETV
jgi:hypothetical protein